MTKLTIVLCIVLFCGLNVNARPSLAGGFHETTPELLTELFPLLERALVDYGTENTEFNGRLKRIVSGRNQVVAGTIYDLVVELENGESQVTEYVAKVSQALDGQLVEVVLTIPGKEYTIRPTVVAGRSKRSPQGFMTFGGFSKASEKELTTLYPALERALADWGTSHSEFGLRLKSIESGESQVVSGTIYNLMLTVEDAENVASEWSANVVENLQGKIVRVTLTIPGKEHLLTFE